MKSVLRLSENSDEQARAFIAAGRAGSIDPAGLAGPVGLADSADLAALEGRGRGAPCLRIAYDKGRAFHKVLASGLYCLLRRRRLFTTARALWLPVIFVLLLCLPAQALASDLILMVIDNNSYLANLAVGGLDVGVDVEVVAAGELKGGGDDLRRRIDGAGVIVVDVMGRELEDYLTKNIDLRGKKVYALRGSTDDERLKRQGFIFDNEVSAYYRHIGEENIRNMLRLVIRRHIDGSVSYGKVRVRPQLGIYYPAAKADVKTDAKAAAKADVKAEAKPDAQADAQDVFTGAEAFLRWQAKRPGYDPKKPRLGLLFFSSFLTPGQREPIDYLIARLEEAGFNVLPAFGRDQQVIDEFLLDDNGKARVDIVLAYSLKFYSALTPQLAEALKKLDVPIISAINLYKDTIDEWRRSPVGIGSVEVAWTMANPEISGLIEPTVLSAKEKIVDKASSKTYYVNRPVPENIDRLIPRLKAWVGLQRKADSEKKLAVIFYNHHQGKQNIGASYLNVFASMQEIMTRLDKAGYSTGDVPGEGEIKKMILTGARNVGSWALGELEEMIDAGDLVLLDLDTYRGWFSELPVAFREKVIAQWGPPGKSKMMTYKGKIVIPMVQTGNLVFMPEPSRGWGDDPMKLYHEASLYPHHQYIAAYLWLQKSFKADAMIHLGTHATYEWTPGKQAGLSPSDSPEVLITDIPNLYPYVVDDVGEALQAKRRGRGVMLSHLTPMLRQSGLYEEYGRMAELVTEYERAAARGSATAAEKRKELETLAETTGVLADMEEGTGHGHVNKDNDEDLVSRLGYYLEEVKKETIPYGMHTYGRVGEDKAIKEMAEAVAQWNPKEKAGEAEALIRASADKEITGLLRGLAGRYVEPGEGNDPLRNPGALPTGRNLYGFNPNRLPTAAAWKLGKKAADDIIRDYLKKNGEYPNKVAVVLWAVELLRNEGVNESTILWLMGIRPRWLKSGRVAGLEVVPGKELGRPRIDVLINASGLYRDLFPEKMELLDDAVQLAIRQTDIENLIARNSRRIKAGLMKSGMGEKEAGELSRLRVFSEESGSYGNGVSEMTGASGVWTQEREIVEVYENRMGFVFGRGRWGERARELFRQNLAGVDVAVHSRSSNLYGLLDNDDMFQYLGGLAMAVRQESGSSPQTLITAQTKAGEVRVEDLARTLGREMRSRYLNPKWIEGMKKEDYAGARAMANFVEYLWGWQVTTPEKVDAAKWQQVYEVYVEDKYGLELKEFFAEANPWSYQAITARMVENIRKGYWKPDADVLRKLAVEYAASIVKEGVACSENTCNNPLMNRMVVSIISQPGVMSPEEVRKFREAIEQAVRKPLQEQVEERKALQQRLLIAPASDKATVKAAPELAPEPVKDPAQELAKPQVSKPMTGADEKDMEEVKKEARGEVKGESRDGVKGETKDGVEVEGYKMEKIKGGDDVTGGVPSGLEWLAGVAVFFVIALMVYGARRSRR